MKAHKLTPEIQKRIIQAIRIGATYEHAASYGGITRVTLWKWLKKGEEAKSGKLKDFHDAVRKAEGEATVGWLAKIEQAASDGAWQAAAWKLERRYPDEYGRQRLDINSDNKVEIKVTRSDDT
jgi:transposase